jgi:hypothetical protein
MSLFKVPKGVHAKILYGSGKNKGIPLIKWDVIEKLKSHCSLAVGKSLGNFGGVKDFC